MKKSLITLSFLSFIAFSVNAQDATPAVAPSGSEFKPSAGNITVEVLASSPFAGSGNPFQLSGSESGIPGLRFRYFLSESTAFRLGFSIDAAKSNVDFGNKVETSGSSTSLAANTSETNSLTPTAYKLTSNRFMVAIAPGLEFHKGISERLSVYYGAYIDFALQSAKGKITGKPESYSSTEVSAAGVNTSETRSSVAGEYSYEIKGQNLNLEDISSPAAPTNGTPDAAAWAVGGDGPNFGGTVANPNTPNNLRNADGRGFTRLGLIGVLGADFYITKALYLGLEVNWGYTNTMYKKIEITEKVTNINFSTTTTGPNGIPVTDPVLPAPVVSGTTKTTENKDNNWNIMPAVNAAFRLGFWF